MAKTPGFGPGNSRFEPSASDNISMKLNWMEHLATDQKVGGSSPLMST